MSASWRCFHCGDVFNDLELAALHFGESQKQQPICQLDVAYLRGLEEALEQYQNEDTLLHREIYKMRSERQTALRRAEEAGYSKGLKDAALREHDKIWPRRK